MYEKFIADHGQHGEDIMQLLSNQDYEQARAVFHTIKGVAGNLGLTGLYETCKFFDEAIKSGDTQTVIDDFSRFETALVKTREALQQIMSGDASSEESTEDESRI